MTAAEILEKNIRDIVDLGRLAPSVHNTQPWKVKLESSEVVISLDTHHALEDGDPTGRQTMISLGIFSEALALGASQYGLDVASVYIHTEQIRITFALGTNPPQKTKGLDSLVTALHTRCSDRSIYKPLNLDEQQLQHIRASSASSTTSSVSTHAITDEAIISKVAALTSNAIGVALSSPAFRHELTQYLVMPGSSRQRGIAVKSLHISRPKALLQPIVLKTGRGLKSEAELEKRRWLSASGLVIITADGDMPKYWFEVGRAYLRASLAIEELGLSQATSAAIVEASNYHEDIEDMLHTKQRILAIIRVGHGSAVKHFSPRISTEQILA
jgi:hypothetical protein